MPSNLDATEPATELAFEAPPVVAGTALAERRWQLVVLSGSRKGEILSLEGQPGTALRVGKAPDSDLVLEDARVSRSHCLLLREANGWVLRDLGSTNGTFIDEIKVREGELRPGSTVRIGNVLMRFAIEHAPVSIPPSARQEFGPLCGKGVAMREIFALLERVSRTEATLLLTGETGTGKGAVARAVHEASPRAAGPFIVVDCGAVAPTLIESELFGHEKGAFTGAAQQRTGALELASGGTLFLDELDDLPRSLQPKLLRALEDRRFQRVGASREQPFEGRVVAATKRDLRALVQAGRFREDLYFRVAVFRIDLPPLRARKEDLPVLFDHFARAFEATTTWADLPEDVRGRLRGHDWPGNLRELRNTIERALVISQGEPPPAFSWSFEDGGRGPRPGPDPDYRLPFKDAKEKLVAGFEREYLVRLLERCDGKVTRAAREAGLDRKYLYTLLAKHRLAGGEDEG